jgi:hypothetical protein
VASRDFIFDDEAFMLNQDETNIHKDSPKEKLTAEVEFDENNLPSDKGNDENDSHHQ